MPDQVKDNKRDELIKVLLNKFMSAERIADAILAREQRLLEEIDNALDDCSCDRWVHREYARELECRISSVKAIIQRHREVLK